MELNNYSSGLVLNRIKKCLVITPRSPNLVWHRIAKMIVVKILRPHGLAGSKIIGALSRVHDVKCPSMIDSPALGVLIISDIIRS